MTYEQIEMDLESVERRIFGGQVSSLSNEDLLRIVFGGEEPAKELLAILTGEPETMVTVESSRASSEAAKGLVAAFELARRRYSPRGKRIRRAADVYPFVGHLGRSRQEIVMAISLNGAHEVLAARVVTVGLLNRCQLHPREVFSDPLKDRAASVIVCHNHPSGSLDVSEEDIRLTRQLVSAGEILGIPLLDHLIVGGDGMMSMREAGMLSGSCGKGRGRGRRR